MSSVQATRATPIIPFVAPLYRTLEPYAYTLIRITAGAIFIPHGLQKLFLATATTPLGYGLGVLELAGGALLALGILTRPIAILLLLHVAAIIVANYPKGWLWTRGGIQYHSFMFGMLLAARLYDDSSILLELEPHPRPGPGSLDRGVKQARSADHAQELARPHR
jgi:putative oxidoreductase